MAALAVLTLVVASPALADPAQDQAVASNIASRFLAPKYAALADAAAADVTAWRAYCAAPDEAGLPALQAAYRKLALAFGQVQAFRFGPIGDGTTAERLYFWPERKNATAKGLADLLDGSAPITAERVERASAAAQGIPALERLAFGDTGAAPPVAGTTDAARRSCSAGVAIAANVADITRAVSTAWNTPGTGYAARLAKGDLDPALAPSMQQAASTLVTGFMTGLAVIQDQKLEPILGDSAEEAKPSAAEARRSGLTVPMILANLQGLKDFVAALEGPITPLQRKSWEALIARLEKQAQALQRDFPDGVNDPARRADAEALLERIKGVRAVLRDEVPIALGLKLGFNGLDGD